MDNIVDVIRTIAATREIPEDVLFESIQAALVTAFKKNFGSNRVARIEFDRETGEIQVYSRYRVVEKVIQPENEISLKDAKEIDVMYELDDVVERRESPEDFGRISAMAAKQVVVQRIREAERSSIYEEFKARENELIYAQIQRISNRVVYFNLGKAEATLPPKEQIPGERYRVGARFRCYIAQVKEETKAPEIVLSRTHPGLIRRLFELEIPEINDGEVLIRSIAREAGSRTKISVFSRSEDLDPVGACVGPKGTRVASIVDELGGEKIDIVEYTDDDAQYIVNALSPAKVTRVDFLTEKNVRVVVPDYQLSLAIGKEGQNARLAAKLTGFKIDIVSESALEEEE